MKGWREPTNNLIYVIPLVDKRRLLGLQRYTDASVNHDTFPTIRKSLSEEDIAILRYNKICYIIKFFNIPSYSYSLPKI